MLQNPVSSMLLVASMALSACSSSTLSTLDAGASDSGASDSGASDSGASDSGLDAATDIGFPDGGPPDASDEGFCSGDRLWQETIEFAETNLGLGWDLASNDFGRGALVWSTLDRGTREQVLFLRRILANGLGDTIELGAFGGPKIAVTSSDAAYVVAFENAQDPSATLLERFLAAPARGVRYNWRECATTLPIPE